MFTGIVKEVGKVEKIASSGSIVKMEVSSALVFKEAEASDSIAVNGVCLTLTAKEKNLLFFDAVSSTFKNTNLKRLKRSEAVNLEPALKLGDKVGGHFVLGHVDCEFKLKRVVNRGGFFELEIDLPAAFRKYIVVNGSVAVEGVSLTVKKILSRSFTVNIIPFTFENTNLKYKKPGSWLNIEFDYLLKGAKKNK